MKQPVTVETVEDKPNCAPVLGSARAGQYGIKVVKMEVEHEGMKYLLSDGVMYPWKICPPEGIPGSTLKPGAKYIDRKAGIKVPNDQALPRGGAKETHE